PRPSRELGRVKALAPLTPESLGHTNKPTVKPSVLAGGRCKFRALFNNWRGYERQLVRKSSVFPRGSRACGVGCLRFFRRCNRYDLRAAPTAAWASGCKESP